jgi:hypothetical protein
MLQGGATRIEEAEEEMMMMMMMMMSYHIFSSSIFTNIQSLDITVRVTDTTVIHVNYTP